MYFEILLKIFKHCLNQLDMNLSISIMANRIITTIRTCWVIRPMMNRNTARSAVMKEAATMADSVEYILRRMNIMIQTIRRIMAPNR